MTYRVTEMPLFKLIHTVLSVLVLAVATTLVLVSGSQAQDRAADLYEATESLMVTVNDMYQREVTGTVVVTSYKPNGYGPFPILILNHGRSATDRSQPARYRYTSQARYFVKRGFAVFVPTRIGYGEMGVSPDPEESGGCNQKNYAPMAQAASTQIAAVLAFAKQQSYVDGKRVVIVGQSVGGYSTIAAAAKNPDGLLAAINFAGGSGGNPQTRPGNPCEGYKLEKMFADFGATAKAPTLWIYTENDKYFNPKHSQAWHQAFVKSGGRAEFNLLPAFAADGHTLFTAGAPLWEPIVARFLDENGFTQPK
jgi:dienelactone hydrolase